MRRYQHLPNFYDYLHTMETLILKGDGYGLEIAPEAVQLKQSLIEHSTLIVEVSDNTAAEAARMQVKKLADMRNVVEKSRKAIKEPVLAVGRKIDDMASQFVAEISTHEKRISGLIGEHSTRVELLRVAAERERAKIEAERIRAEQEANRKREEEERERLKAAAEAEAAKKQAEEAAQAAAKQAAGDDDEDIDAQLALAAAYDAENAARRLAEERAAEAMRAETNRQAEIQRMADAQRHAAMIAETAKTSGVRYEPEFEVTDIHALYRHHADLVELTPKRREILSRIKSLMVGDGLPSIPGLYITKKAVVSTR